MTLEKSLINEMKAVFSKDEKRVRHAFRVTHYAKQLLEEEEGKGEVVIPAAILHDIGIHEAEKKYGSAAGSHQEKEGPPIARNILKKLGIDESIIEEICSIVGNHHSPEKIDTLNFKILYDADWLVNLPDEYNCKNKEKLSRIIEKIFLTDTGKKLAEKIYLDDKFSNEA